MGLFGRDKKKQDEPVDLGDDRLTKFIQQLLNLGIDGMGPLKSAKAVAEKARGNNKDTDDAIKDVVRSHLKLATTGGFITGLGGFVTLPIALPANVLEFYVSMTRMVAAIAHLRGYDISKPEVRSAVLLTLTGENAKDVLSKVGAGAASGTITNLALGKLPRIALTMVNKGVAFQILRSTSTKLLSKLGKGIPVLGGVVGGTMDAMLAKRLADAARKDFPQR